MCAHFLIEASIDHATSWKMSGVVPYSFPIPHRGKGGALQHKHTNQIPSQLFGGEGTSNKTTQSKRELTQIFMGWQRWQHEPVVKTCIDLSSCNLFVQVALAPGLAWQVEIGPALLGLGYGAVARSYLGRAGQLSSVSQTGPTRGAAKVAAHKQPNKLL
eukprot:6228507-Amphidinium_carterae.1